MNQPRQPSISQTNLISQVSPNLNYKSIIEELEQHDKLYLEKPPSLGVALKEMIRDTEQLNAAGNFDFTPVLAILAKIEHLDPIDAHNNFKISEILTKIWRFAKHYNFMNKLLFYDTLASLAHPFNPTKICATLVMFYIPHVKNMDHIYHKVYQPKF